MDPLEEEERWNVQSTTIQAGQGRILKRNLSLTIQSQCFTACIMSFTLMLFYVWQKSAKRGAKRRARAGQKGCKKGAIGAKNKQKGGEKGRKRGTHREKVDERGAKRGEKGTKRGQKGGKKGASVD